MDYEHARAKGDSGEHLVREAIRAGMGLGSRMVDDLLLELPDGTTFQLDHVVIDRFGILLVETKCYGAWLKGTSYDKYWTACYKGKQHHRMLNPIRQNEQHRERLHLLLATHGRPLAAEYVQSLIVFAEGATAGLDLSDVDQMRVVEAAGVGSFLKERSNFQPNPGELRETEIEELANLLLRLDRSMDPVACERHGERVRKASGKRSVKSAPSSSRRSDTGRKARWRTPQRTYAGRTGTATTGPSSPSRFAEPQRHVGGPGIAEHPRRSVADALRVLARTVTGLAVMLMLLILATVALPVFTRALTPRASSTVYPVVAAPVQPRGVVDVSEARAQLRDVMPELEAALVNPDKPTIGERKGLTSYTWEYVKKTSGKSVDIRKITIVLDDSGRIVGVD